MAITGMSKKLCAGVMLDRLNPCRFRFKPKNTLQGHTTVRVLEQSHCEIALADTRADARREDSTAIYLRCYTPKRAPWQQ